MKSEQYETFINKRRYIFAVKFDGHVWIARAFHEHRLTTVGVVSGNNPEEAALKLVKQLETGSQLKNLLK